MITDEQPVRRLPKIKRKKAHTSMKKFLALLLMALLLIPALAMAEINQTKPSLTLTENDFADAQVKLSGNPSSGGRRWLVEPTSRAYTAIYSIGGQLQSYYKHYDCGCTVTFNCYDEAITISNSFGNQFGSECEVLWNHRKEAWDVYKGHGDDRKLYETFSSESMNHAFAANTHPSLNVKETTEPIRLPNNIAQCVSTNADYSVLKNLCTNQRVGGVWPDTVETLSNNSSYTHIKNSDDGQLWRMSTDLGNVYAFYYDNQFFESYIGNVYFTTFKGTRNCRITGDKRYGINTYGHYYYDTGVLEDYQFYSADRSVNSVYNTLNVLLSTETWDENNGWWGLDAETQKWSYSKNGNPDDAVDATPTDYVLENILHAPGPAEYDSQCVTNIDDLDGDLGGVPFILADASMTSVTPHIEATQSDDNPRETEFDITLMKDGQETSLTKPVTLTLGFPAGITSEIADNYEYLVIHNNNEYMSSTAGNLKVTDNGPQVTATSFSPYTVVWGTAEYLDNYRKVNYPGAVLASSTAATPNLPQTGDSSNLALYAVLLTLSVGALAVLLVAGKRRANR